MGYGMDRLGMADTCQILLTLRNMGNLTGSKDKRKSKLGKKLTFSKYTFQIRCLMVINYGTSTW